MFTKNDYYSAYLTMRVLHFNAFECGCFDDMLQHFQAVQAVNQMRAELPAREQAEVELEVDSIFNTDGIEAAA